MAMVIWVDDFFLVDNNTKARELFVDKLGKRFKLTDLGQINWLLGMKINVSDDGIQINQEKYINDMLKRFGLEECKPALTPITPGSGMQESEPFPNKSIYMSLVG